MEAYSTLFLSSIDIGLVSQLVQVLRLTPNNKNTPKGALPVCPYHDDRNASGVQVEQTTYMRREIILA
jgi:hypothetical protein